MEENDAYFGRMKAHIDEISIDLQKMRARAGRMETEAQLAYLKKLDELESEKKSW